MYFSKKLYLNFVVIFLISFEIKKNHFEKVFLNIFMYETTIILKK